MTDERMHGQPDLDNEIEHALACYLEEPRAGAEQRVIARVTAAPVCRRWWESRAAFAAASVIAALGIAALLWAAPWRSAPTPETNMAQTHVATRGVVIPSRPAEIAKTATKVAPTRHRVQLAKTHRPRKATAVPQQPLPKLAVFPAPEPMTAQQAALLELATNDPQLALRAFQKTKPPAIHPLEIKPLHIAPLPTAQSQENSHPTFRSTENEE